MTRDEAVAVIAARLGNRGSTFDTQIVTEMKLMQTELEQMPMLPWFLLVHDTSLATVAEMQTVAVPTAFLLEDDYSHMFITDNAASPSTTRVVKGTYDDLKGAKFYGTNKLSERFALQKETLYFFPTPNDAYSLDWFYFGADTVLSTDVENEWLKRAPELMISRTGLKIARFLRDQGAQELFQADANEALNKMWAQDESRRQAALDAYMGG